MKILRQSKIIALMLCFFSLSGCVGVLYNPSCSKKFGESSYALERIISKADLKSIFEKIAQEFCDKKQPSNCSPQGMSPAVLVADFVDIQSLEPQHTGILMAELMKSGLNNNCCNRIVQAEFSKFFKLSEKGLIALTRDPKEILKDEYPFTECIVGTYNYSSDKLYIFVRRINIYTGEISKIVSREISFSCYGDSVTTSVR